MMQYSNIRSRAGLVAVVFVLIISLVSAVPIPVTESGLSSTFKSLPHNNPSLNGHDIKLDTARIPESSLSGQMSTLTAARALARRQQISTNMDDRLVRRSIGSKIKHAFQSLGHKIKSGFQKAGSAIKTGFQKAGTAIKTGFQKAGTAIKHVAEKVKTGVVSAAKKVGNFMKTTGAKIAKFGFKVVEAVGNAVGTVASFIPEIGKPIQQAIHGVSKVAGVISDHIHAKLSSKLQKGMDVMNKADQAMSYIPRRRDLSEEETFQQRDISEAYYFEERDDIEFKLENREESYFEANERRGDIYERYDLD